MTKEEILDKLKEVIDPELNINIVDMGLIYEIKIDKGNVGVLMTLTTPGCPMMGMLDQEVAEKIKKIKGVKKVKVEVTFDPPWTLQRMSKEARKKIYG
jgi:metal-sulfur cluster biosynthetic enzyme